MCTAVTYKTENFYFGRTLDYEFSYKEEITVTPRNFPLSFRHIEPNAQHYAMIGMAYVVADFPLYYDAMNEKGLCIAGLNFVGNAVYSPPSNSKINIAQFELIPYLLSTCGSVTEAKAVLKRINITNTSFSHSLPSAQLHWLIADKNEAITVEAVKEGIKIHGNPVGVLTNNPPFEQQMLNLSNYMGVSNKPPENHFSKQIELNPYSRGMGGIGLPGDLSSSSRFVRAAFVKCNSVCGSFESESVNQFFHILSSVEQQRGCCEVEKGKYEVTIYSSCCNADKGIYYYTTYGNHRISAVNMFKEKIDGNKLLRFGLKGEEDIEFHN